jgi:Ca2+-binding EF-hand superfamily protein
MGPRVFTALAITSACVLASPVFADGAPQSRRAQQQQPEGMRFRAMDRNGDGKITRQEWRGSDQSFRVHDWNRDGVLSGDEVRPGAQRSRDLNDFDPQRSRQYSDWTEEAFVDLDHNRDGRITKNEWHYDNESWLRADRNRDNALTRAEFVGDITTDLDREDRFEYLDANNNGRIDRAEWHGTADAFRWLDRDGNGVLSREEVVGEAAATDADVFTSLDYNRDGRLSQDEWHWSRRSFLQQDINRDGVVSRDEFTSPEDQPAGTSGRTARRDGQVIVVNAKERWVDTGIDLQAGDNITVQSEGTVRLSSNGNDSSAAAGANRRALNAPMPNHPAGALIARVGNGAPIFLGDSTGARNVTTGGRLYLGVNDDHLDDNSGEFRVRVTVRR